MPENSRRTPETPLARAHRSVAEMEHGVERALLSIAVRLPAPEETRARARELSARADEHQQTADRIDAQHTYPSAFGDDS